MNDLSIDQHFIYKSEQKRRKEQSPYSNRDFLNYIKKSLADVAKKRFSVDHYEYSCKSKINDSSNKIIITQDSIQQYAKEAQNNPHNSAIIKAPFVNYSLQCSPSNDDSKRRRVLPKVIIARAQRKAHSKRRTPKVQALQNPQEGPVEEKLQEPQTEKDDTLPPIIQKAQVKVQPMNRKERFEQLMNIKLDPQIVELKELVRKMQKPKKVYKERKVTFLI